MCSMTASSSIQDRPMNLPPTKRGCGRSPAPAPRNGGCASRLRKGGSVNFDGIQIGEIKSLKLDNPRKVVALAMVDNGAPIRKDTVVGLEFQGLTGIAAISLVGGAAAAPPVPLDEDGIPILTADLSETESIRDSLHNVDRILGGKQAMVKNALQNFETSTSSLASKR